MWLSIAVLLRKLRPSTTRPITESRSNCNRKSKWFMVVTGTQIDWKKENNCPRNKLVPMKEWIACVSQVTSIWNWIEDIDNIFMYFTRSRVPNKIIRPACMPLNCLFSTRADIRKYFARFQPLLIGGKWLCLDLFFTSISKDNYAVLVHTKEAVKSNCR